MSAALTPVVAGIFLEGMKAWNQGRKARFMKKWKKVIQRLRDAENNHFPNYTDAELNLAEEEFDTFTVAYHAELVSHNAEAGHV